MLEIKYKATYVTERAAQDAFALMQAQIESLNGSLLGLACTGEWTEGPHPRWRVWLAAWNFFVDGVAVSADWLPELGTITISKANYGAAVAAGAAMDIRSAGCCLAAAAA